MGHDPRWCFDHGIEVYEFRVPETGARVWIPVTAHLAVVGAQRMTYGALARARSTHPGAEFKRRLVPRRTPEGGYEWEERRA